MKIVFHLRCKQCNRLFGKLLLGKGGERIISFKCPRCSKGDGEDHYCNFDLAELERFFEAPGNN